MGITNLLGKMPLELDVSKFIIVINKLSFKRRHLCLSCTLKRRKRRWHLWLEGAEGVLSADSPAPAHPAKAEPSWGGGVVSTLRMIFQSAPQHSVWYFWGRGWVPKMWRQWGSPLQWRSYGRGKLQVWQEPALPFKRPVAVGRRAKDQHRRC